MASTAGRAPRARLRVVAGDGGVDQGDDRAGGVAVGGRVEQGGGDRGGGAEPGAHGIRERLDRHRARGRRAGRRRARRRPTASARPRARPARPPHPQPSAQWSPWRHRSPRRRQRRRMPSASHPLVARRPRSARGAVRAARLPPASHVRSHPHCGKHAGGRGRGARCATATTSKPGSAMRPPPTSTSSPTSTPHDTAPAGAASRTAVGSATASEVTTGSTDPRTERYSAYRCAASDRRGDPLPLHHLGHERRDGRGQRGSRNRPVRGHGATLSRGLL